MSWTEIDHSKLLSLESYPEEINSPVTVDEFLRILESTIDTSTNIVEAGHVPGSKGIRGSVQGSRFKLEKAGMMVNPFARRISGRVIPDSRSGCKVEYRMDRQATVTFTGIVVVACTIGLTVMALIGAGLTYLRFGNAFARPEMLIAILLPLAVLLLWVIVWRVGCYTSYSEEEELLDHLKKVSVGIETSS